MPAQRRALSTQPYEDRFRSHGSGGVWTPEQATGELPLRQHDEESRSRRDAPQTATDQKPVRFSRQGGRLRPRLAPRVSGGETGVADLDPVGGGDAAAVAAQLRAGVAV
jgi:hypothetical protein